MKTKKAAKTVSHTPGPWTGEANARLLSAALDLLEVAKEAYDLFASKESLSADAVEVWGHIDRAIAKAEGR